MATLAKPPEDNTTQAALNEEVAPKHWSEGVPEDAALEKARAGESLAVEHIAELAPGQARTARARALFQDNDDKEKSSFLRKRTALPRAASRRSKRIQK